MKTAFQIAFLVITFFALSHDATGQTIRKLGTSRPLADYPEEGSGNPFQRQRWREAHEREHKKIRGADTLTNRIGRPDALWQSQPLQVRGPLANLRVDVNVASLDENTTNVDPPDPCGAVSDSFYLHMVNGFDFTRYRVFNKRGTLLRGGTLEFFWTSFNVSPYGDPICLYDQNARRFLMSELADTSILIAISKTTSPLGAWDVYEIKTTEFPDYPKMGIWNNCYYITTNELPDVIPTYLINRQKMIAGENLTANDVKRTDIPLFNNPDVFQVATPFDWSSATPPPVNSPLYIARMYDNSWVSNNGNDRIEVWSIPQPNFSNNSIPVAVQQNIFTTPFDDNLMDLGTGLKQPNNVLLDPLQDVLMFRAAYRNFGTYEAVALCHIADVAGNDKAGIRWYELRKNVGTTNWAIYQEGTFAPDTAVHRFMPSIAINASGDIAMVYMTTSYRTFPALYATGRLAADPLGTMTTGEVLLAAGLSSNDVERAGDYSCINVDPSDGVTFWATGQHFKTGNNWGTRVASFRFAPGTPTVELRTDDIQARLFPNPASAQTNLEIWTTSESAFTSVNKTFSVIDALGRTVLTQQLEQQGKNLISKINTAAIASGIYYIRFEDVTLRHKNLKFLKIN